MVQLWGGGGRGGDSMGTVIIGVMVVMVVVGDGVMMGTVGGAGTNDGRSTGDSDGTM
jgi:hypothetical protein